MNLYKHSSIFPDTKDFSRLPETILTDRVSDDHVLNRIEKNSGLNARQISRDLNIYHISTYLACSKCLRTKKRNANFLSPIFFTILKYYRLDCRKFDNIIMRCTCWTSFLGDIWKILHRRFCNTYYISWCAYVLVTINRSFSTVWCKKLIIFLRKFVLTVFSSCNSELREIIRLWHTAMLNCTKRPNHLFAETKWKVTAH